MNPTRGTRLATNAQANLVIAAPSAHLAAATWRRLEIAFGSPARRIRRSSSRRVVARVSSPPVCLTTPGAEHLGDRADHALASVPTAIDPRALPPLLRDRNYNWCMSVRDSKRPDCPGGSVFLGGHEVVRA